MFVGYTAGKNCYSHFTFSSIWFGNIDIRALQWINIKLKSNFSVKTIFFKKRKKSGKWILLSNVAALCPLGYHRPWATLWRFILFSRFFFSFVTLYCQYGHFLAIFLRINTQNLKENISNNLLYCSLDLLVFYSFGNQKFNFQRR